MTRLLVLAGVWTACQPPGSNATPAADRIGVLMPDFALVDTNGTSSTSGLDVSPRDYAGMRSAWYFGHAT